MSDMEKLTLSNVCDGKLDKQFQRKYPEVLANLKDGQKATVTISIAIARPEGSATMVGITGKMTTKMPPSDAMVSLYSFDEGFNVKTEKIPEPNGEQGVIQFPNALSQAK